MPSETCANPRPALRRGMRAYYRPIPSCDPACPPSAVRLAGGWTWCDRVEVLRRGASPRIVSIADIPDAARQRLIAPRRALGNVSLDRPRLMGILNTTPDSFSDGGRHAAGDAAVERARAMLAEGADIIDIGGESTRPGAAEVAVSEEIARTAPVIAALCGGKEPRPLVSLDTRKSAVARSGLDAGATIVNDVSGLRFDPTLARLAAERDCPVILMHSIGTPDTMQGEAEGAYTDVLLDVFDALSESIDKAVSAGIARDRIVVDPGIGFGKTDAHNLALIARLSLFHALECPILLGVSRKGLIGKLASEPQADRRGPGSAGVGLWALSQGVQILRVHDIRMHKHAISLWWAAQNGD